MKRYLSTVLAIALTMGCLSGCGSASSSSSAPAASGSSASGDTSSAAAPKGGGEITIMGNARMYDGEEAAWNEVTADFTAKTGIKVNLRWQGKWDELFPGMHLYPIHIFLCCGGRAVDMGLQPHIRLAECLP